MLDLHTALAYLRNELKQVNRAINAIEAVAAAHYARRERVARQKAAEEYLLAVSSNERSTQKPIMQPLPSLNPETNLWLQ